MGYCQDTDGLLPRYWWAIAKIRMGYCQDTDGLLPRYWWAIAKILMGYCQDTDGLLPRYWWAIAKILMGYCKSSVPEHYELGLDYSSIFYFQVSLCLSLPDRSIWHERVRCVHSPRHSAGMHCVYCTTTPWRAEAGHSDAPTETIDTMTSSRHSSSSMDSERKMQIWRTQVEYQGEMFNKLFPVLCCRNLY